MGKNKKIDSMAPNCGNQLPHKLKGQKRKKKNSQTVVKAIQNTANSASRCIENAQSMNNKLNLKAKNSSFVKRLKSVLTKEKGKVSQISQQERNTKKPKVLDAKEKLKAARFRFINEQLYTQRSQDAFQFFADDPDSFLAYHEGFQNQVKKWPINPLDLVIKDLQRIPKTEVIVDFGCGEARLAQSLQNKVFSFDLVSVNEHVVACDMANVPLESGAADVAVFCLSLMGININDFLLEANRVLKKSGRLKLAEVESRCQDTSQFLKTIEKFGFRLVNKDLKHSYFFLADFVKIHNVTKTKFLPQLKLKPCFYKKR